MDIMKEVFWSFLSYTGVLDHTQFDILLPVE